MKEPQMSRSRPAFITVAGAIGVASAVTLALVQAPLPQPGKPLAGPNGERLVHVFDEPRHKTVFEQGTIRVLDIQIPPGDTTLFHTHDTAMLYVNIGRSQTRSQILGKEWSGGGASTSSAAAPAAPPQAASAMFSVTGYVKEPQTHQVNNVGTSTFRLIGVSNASAGGAGLDDETPGIAGELEIANDYFRGYRHTLAPGASVAAHVHRTPVVVVQVNEGQVKADGASGTLRGSGSFAYVAAGQAHAIANAGQAAVTVVEVEVRQPVK
jgi:quercetin dioxygenase-like cupin family protein